VERNGPPQKAAATKARQEGAAGAERSASEQHAERDRLPWDIRSPPIGVSEKAKKKADPSRKNALGMTIFGFSADCQKAGPLEWCEDAGLKARRYNA
jgi:hypothetical protein